MKIEFYIPAYNEEKIIAEAARTVLSVLARAGGEVSVTVVDNASTDGTARSASAVAGVSVLSVPLQGKGAAVVAAARRSQADIFGFIDADLSADPEDIIPLLSLVEQGNCDIAIGSRLLNPAKVDRGNIRTLSSRLFNIARKAIVGVKVQDTQCGLKIMNVRGRKRLAACVETGWFFDIEFLARAERGNLRIQEMPVHWKEQRFSNRDSKLSLLRDSVGALRAMFRIRRRLTNQ